MDSCQRLIAAAIAKGIRNGKEHLAWSNTLDGMILGAKLM